MTDAPSPTDRTSTDDEPTADDRSTADGRSTADDRPLPNGGSNPADRSSEAVRPDGDDAGARTESAHAAAPSADRDVRSYVYWVGFAILSLLAVVALFRFYTSATAAIDLWVEPEFEPIMQAAFNLVVLLLAGIGISWTVRQLS